jgi:hypothetical protein
MVISWNEVQLRSMRPGELVIGLVTGAVLLFLGLVPGFFQELVNDVRNGIRNFHNSLSSPIPIRPRYEEEYEQSRAPLGLAIAGAVIIVLTIAGYVWTG